MLLLKKRVSKVGQESEYNFMELIDNIKRKRVDRKRGFTIIDDIFIPMFIGDNEKMQAVMAGNIVLEPALEEPNIRELLSKIPRDYIGKSEREALKNGGFANLA